MNAPLVQPNASPLLRRARHAHEAGELEKAERHYSAVLAHQPQNFDALHGLGGIHQKRGRLDSALVLFQEALKADPNRPDGYASLGLVFYALKDFTRALVSFEAALRLAPDDVELRNCRGVALLDLGRPRQALEDFERVLADAPGHFEALGNRANALFKLNRPAAAIELYDRALAIQPGNAQLLTNRAIALRRLERPQEALTSAARAIAAQPDFAPARFVEASVRLYLGDFPAGWRGYEWRRGGAFTPQRRRLAAPLWLGEQSLAGKTILLHAEQGFGDTIQFVRYAPFLAERGARVILEVQPQLVRLLSGIAGVAQVLPRKASLPPFDFHCPLLSLPLAIGTVLETIPSCVSYLAPPTQSAAYWQARLPSRRPLIGLAWAGERAHDNDVNRSMRLEALAPLLDLPDAWFVSLQRDLREDDVPFLNTRADLAQIGHEFSDFADTAGAIAALDAVIAVDTAVAHLAGALGKPLFLLLPFAADFRWLRARGDSPWYPTARILRQSRFGDWAGAIEQLVGAVSGLVRHLRASSGD
ncbi:MAG: tetratricopeptide repeat-containing glycosyltransferase family protein [Xanthobacteraceae bacterium]